MPRPYQQSNKGPLHKPIVETVALAKLVTPQQSVHLGRIAVQRTQPFAHDLEFRCRYHS
jgi:hypothetical protein